MGDMGLRNVESTLPPGFRFYPSDEELVCHYLYKKVHEEGVSREGTMVEVDLHTCEPWELPEVARLGADQWYFFSFRDRKYSTGSRTNRATKTGYWKATGKDRAVHAPSSRRTIVGMRKTLVFYGGRAPNGIKSGWVMHEFRLENPYAPPTKEDWVLCRVFHKKKGEEDNNNMMMMSQCPNSPTDLDCYSSSPPPPPSQQMVANLSLLQQQQQEEGGSTYDHHHHHEYCSSSTSSSFFDVSTFLQCNYLHADFPPQAGGAKVDHVDMHDYFGLNLDHDMGGIMDLDQEAAAAAAAGFGNLEQYFRI